MNLITTAKYVLTVTEVIRALLPIISSTVKQVEESVGPGNGAHKTELVVNLMKVFYDQTSAPVPFDDLVATIRAVIVPIVTFYNNVGTFVKGIKAAA